ncbi:MAG TPA: hypothetical protein VN673_06510, partial [Clostridia bacterium]|nr:hypothetical protein [Clostridia bacterium]
MDIVHVDGSPLWGQTVSFSCGTHDWEYREFVLLPDKPIRSLTLHCLFRGHTGKVWFDDVSLEEVATPAGALMYQGVPIVPAGSPALPSRGGTSFTTKDRFGITLSGHRVASVRLDEKELAAHGASGWLARDHARNTGFYGFTNGVCPELGLEMNAQCSAQADHVVLEGYVRNTGSKDRAITLVFALPVEASGWQWGEDVRTATTVEGNGEFANQVTLRSGANGKMSRYPIAAIWNKEVGLGLGLDMDYPAQYRLVYHAGARQFLIAYDFGLTGAENGGLRDAERGAGAATGARFRFVLYRFEPRWEFRAALQKYYEIFPQQFTRRVNREGVWMPFTDISTVPGFEDFGFAFQEGAPNVAFDDRHDIASFVYVEPMSYWLELPLEAPRTYESAMAVLHEDLKGARGREKERMAAATLSSGIHARDGQLSLYLVKAPWCDGGVFTLSPDPDLSSKGGHSITKATVMQEAIAAAFKKHHAGTNSPGAGLDGLYFDSLEMSSAQLNYRREHFGAGDVPLVFDPEGRPAQLMILNTWKFVRSMTDRLHAEGKLTFANGALWNFSFPAPLLDVMGTEVNWLAGKQYRPDSDAVMNFRRALCRQKPYCLLMNTDYETFTEAFVERYFQRCLFYGIWPGFFDQDAASKDPYWASAKRWY